LLLSSHPHSVAGKCSRLIRLPLCTRAARNLGKKAFRVDVVPSWYSMSPRMLQPNPWNCLSMCLTGVLPRTCWEARNRPSVLTMSLLAFGSGPQSSAKPLI
jgi:hypothetical protein